MVRGFRALDGQNDFREFLGVPVSQIAQQPAAGTMPFAERSVAQASGLRAESRIEQTTGRDPIAKFEPVWKRVLPTPGENQWPHNYDRDPG